MNNDEYIKCYGCGNEVRANLKYCPFCNTPMSISKSYAGKKIKTSSNVWKKYLVITVVCIMIAFISGYFLLNFIFYNNQSKVSGDIVDFEENLNLEAITDDGIISGWIYECDKSGDGTYILQYNDKSTNDYTYLIYRKGLNTGVKFDSYGKENTGNFSSNYVLNIVYDNDFKLPWENSENYERLDLITLDFNTYNYKNNPEISVTDKKFFGIVNNKVNFEIKESERDFVKEIK